VQRCVADGRIFAVEGVIKFVGRTGKNGVLSRGWMFDADVIADERAVIGPTEEGRTGGVGVAGGIVDLVFEIEVNAEGDLVQVVQANGLSGLTLRPVGYRQHQCRQNCDDRDDNEEFDEGESVLWSTPRFHMDRGSVWGLRG